jgi:oxygen-dependent protoporphyrinogen oxidase
VAAKANRFDVAVDGDDVPAMLAALEIARYGFRVALIESVEPRALPEYFTNEAGTIAALCDEFSVTYTIADVPSDEWAIVGIPGNPFSPQVVQTLGWRGAWRVYADRVLPLLAIGNEDNLGRLVTKRIGKKAAEVLVLPALIAQHGAENLDVRVDDVAHGLSQAVSRVGSLTAGVLELIATDPGWGQRVHIDGGAQALVESLRAKLEFFAVRRVPDREADRVEAAMWLEGVAASTEFYSWSRLIPRVREKAAVARAQLLSDPEKPPVGPIDLER